MAADPTGSGPPRRIDILLATYDGAAFLVEQIDSIFRQSYGHWRILARDDGSSDETAAILRRYADRHPDRFVLVTDDDGNLGYVHNFARLMEHATAPYLAFCDQDDVWRDDKLASSLDRMRALERDHGPSTPLLVHTDLETVDRSLRSIATSFWRYQGLRPDVAEDLGRLLVHNVVTGCTMLINAPLKELSLPIPAQARVHDWWIALVAAALGVVGEVAAPTVLYRQHGSNAIGSKPSGGWRFWLRVLEFLGSLRNRRAHLFATWEQARSLEARYRDRLTPSRRKILDDLLAVPTAGLARRLLCAYRHGGLPLEGLYWIAFALFVPDRCQTGESAAAKDPADAALRTKGPIL